MATRIKKVTLKSLSKNKEIDPTKGTVTNPFTQEEYNQLCHTGEWTGGYVEGMGYIYPPMMDGMGDGSGSGSTQFHFLKIKPGQANSQTIKIDNHDDFSIYIVFSWDGKYPQEPGEGGDAGTVAVRHSVHMPESPIVLNANNKRYTYEIKEGTINYSTVDRVIPGSYEEGIGNNYFKVNMSFHYKKTILDLGTGETTIFKDKISSETYEVNITSYLYWQSV